MTQITSQCMVCTRFNPKLMSANVCMAFPNPDADIPPAIIQNLVDHRLPVDGDHGFRWQARDNEPHPLGPVPEPPLN